VQLELLADGAPTAPALGSLWQVARPGLRVVLRLESVTADDPTFCYRLCIVEIEARNSTLWQVGDSFDVELAWFTKRVDVSPAGGGK
jgi:hypothetical protein